jgi:hypothetical protein
MPRPLRPPGPTCRGDRASAVGIEPPSLHLRRLPCTRSTFTGLRSLTMTRVFLLDAERLPSLLATSAALGTQAHRMNSANTHGSTFGQCRPSCNCPAWASRSGNCPLLSGPWGRRVQRASQDQDSATTCKRHLAALMVLSWFDLLLEGGLNLPVTGTATGGSWGSDGGQAGAGYTGGARKQFILFQGAGVANLPG